MLKKILHFQSKSVSVASLILALSYFASALLGLLRDRLLAGTFGAGKELDVYYTAFIVPDFVALILIFGAISSAVIPIFTALKTRSHQQAWDYVNALLNVFMVFLIVVCLAMIALAPFVMSIIAPGFSGAKKDMAVALMRIMFLSPIILGASNIVAGILQTYHRFLITAVAPLLYNLGIICGIVVFVPYFGLKGLAYGVVLGATMHLAIQLPSFFFSGFRYKFNFNYKNPGVKKTIQLMGPRSLGLGAGQLNNIAITAIASTLMSGSIAVFNLASNLSGIFVNTIAVSMSTAMFPAMSAAYLEENEHTFLTKFSGIFRQTIFLMIPISVLIIILRAQIVRVFLGVGKFDWVDTKLTVACLGILAFSLCFQGLVFILSKTFYAAHNTKIPAIISVATVVFNIALSVALVQAVKIPAFFIFMQMVFRLGDVKNMGVVALALAFSVTAVLEASCLMWFLWRKFPKLKVKEIVDSLFKITIACFAMGLFTVLGRQMLGTYLNLQSFWAVLAQLLVPGFLGVFVYGAAALWMSSPEIKTIKTSFLSKFSPK